MEQCEARTECIPGVGPPGGRGGGGPGSVLRPVFWRILRVMSTEPLWCCPGAGVVSRNRAKASGTGSCSCLKTRVPGRRGRVCACSVLLCCPGAGREGICSCHASPELPWLPVSAGWAGMLAGARFPGMGRAQGRRHRLGPLSGGHDCTVLGARGCHGWGQNWFGS